MQPVELVPAGRTVIEMGAGGLIARLESRLPQRDELVDGQVRHATASSPSQRRSRPCARASWDLEKLVVLPIIPAISSWV